MIIMMRYLVLLLVSSMMWVGGGCETGEDPSPRQTMSPEQPEAVQDLPSPDSATAARFQQVMDLARQEDLHERPIGEVMQTIGEQFTGAPYIVGPLDQTEDEVLVCRLDGFDCFTFIESMLAMARGIKQQEYDFESYAQRMLEQRYRDGQMNGYCSRMHYFSEWIADNEERGNVRNVSEEIGGRRLPKELTFMSENRESYPRFAENDSVYQCIQDMERDLAELRIHHIPQDSIRAVYDQLQAGDIIATSTHIDGLDVTHTGLVYRHPNGGTGLLHASTEGGVKVSPDLQEYVQGIDSQIGIVVARPVFSGGGVESNSY